MTERDVIDKFLAEGKLDNLRARFATKEGRAQMQKILKGILPDLYTESGTYVGAIVQTYFEDQPAAKKLLTSKLKSKLKYDDRERCIIALLAAQGAQYPLSLHIYLAMMLNVTPHEVAHILLLSGVYTGVNRFADAMFVHLKTLSALAGMKDDPSPAAVNATLAGVFGIALPKPQ